MDRVFSRLRFVVCLALSLAAGLLSAGCAQERAPREGASVPAAPGTPREAATVRTRLRVVRLEISLRVGDVPRSAASLRALAARLEGYLERSSASEEGRAHAELTLRVPVERVEALRQELSRLGTVARQVESATDVTEEHEDRAARVRNLHVTEQRLRELLAERAGALSEVLAVEEHLGRVREQTERLEAQQRQLDGQLNFATVELSLTQGSTSSSLLAQLRDAGLAGVGAARELLFLLALGLLHAGPSVALLASLAGGALLARRALRGRRVAQPQVGHS